MASGTLNSLSGYTYGTSGIWTYRKYNDGTYHAWYEGGVNLGTGTAFGTGGLFYHSSLSSLDPPSFSVSVTSMSGSVNGAVLGAFVGYNTAEYKTYWLNATSGSVTNYLVRLDMYGTW